MLLSLGKRTVSNLGTSMMEGLCVSCTTNPNGEQEGLSLRKDEPFLNDILFHHFQLQVDKSSKGLNLIE